MLTNVTKSSYLGVTGFLDTSWKLAFVQRASISIHSYILFWYKDFLNVGDTKNFFLLIWEIICFTWKKPYKGLILSIYIHCWPKYYSTYAHAKSPYFGAKNMISSSFSLNKVDQSVVNYYYWNLSIIQGLYLNMSITKLFFWQVSKVSPWKSGGYLN